MSYIELFSKYTQPYESPSSFWKWSSYTAIAAVLRDNCYSQLGNKRVYPNIYVLLLAESAAHRKGNPVETCEALVQTIKNTKVISGRSSIQAILDELARGETDPKTGIIMKGGSALFSARELSAGLVQDPQSVGILTDMYDFSPVFTSRLRGSGSFKINNLCFTMMAASNENLLVDTYDTRALFGGLLGRTFLIKPSEFRPGNSLWTVNHDEKKFTDLVSELRQISNLKGEFDFDDSARMEYDTWYYPFRESYKVKADKAGVLGRLHTGVVKLAMILGVNETRALVVQKHHMEQAIQECLDLLPNYQQFLIGGGKSPMSEIGTILLTEAYNEPGHQISRKLLLQRHWHNFDNENLDKLVTTLEQAGMIQVLMLPDNKGIDYKLTQKCVDLLFSKEKKNATT